ncbi:MAG: hypothetical protein ACKO0M_15975, partial [Cyanobium sp.]
FGISGLLGFAAKKHDYQYTINYVTDAGDTQTALVAFRNNVPANQFMMELTGMTGLSVGQVNQALEGRLQDMKAQAAEQARINSLACAPALKAYKCSWNAYLTANPAVQIWAKSHPQLVEGEKARLGAVD